VNKLILAIGAVAFATPALAQTTAPAAMPLSASPATSAPTAAPQDATTAGTPSAAAPTADSSPAAIIATEFPTYDKDGNGVLSAAEFDGWMVALKAKSGSPEMKPADKKAWLDGAFATADKDKNKAVSQAELTTYLTAGA
jgi:Ca2+-binding EF-hand superfamily protein